MLVTKVIKAGVIKLTNFKKESLDFEYNGFQNWMIFGIDNGIYSSYKAAKKWNYKNINYKDHPLFLWSKLTKINYNSNNKLSKYWINIRTKKKYGGIWVAFKPHKELPDFKYLKDSLLIKNKKGNYELRLIFQYEVPEINYNNILAIDLGDKNIATVCDSSNLKPIFYGRNIRGIRRHYNFLRKKLGEKKLLKKITDLEDKEKRIIEQELHKISNNIVKQAKETNSIITIGDLKGIRKNSKGKRFNRIISNMPYYKLTQIISYKANQSGIQVVKIKENYTSKTCSKCGSIGKRLKQGLFKCSNCKYEVNADFNGCKNILKRSLDYMFRDGVTGLNPKICQEQISVGIQNINN